MTYGAVDNWDMDHGVRISFQARHKGCLAYRISQRSRSLVDLTVRGPGSVFTNHDLRFMPIVRVVLVSMAVKPIRRLIKMLIDDIGVLPVTSVVAISWIEG
jgi:hypothetical protein